MTDTEAGSGENAVVGDARIALKAPSGPFPVGVIDFDLEDTGREEMFDPGSCRRIPVRAWYPAKEVSGSPRPYAKPEEMERQIIPFWTKGLGLPEEVARSFDVPTHSYEAAAPADDGPFPTLIFSHGGFAYLQTNTALMEHLASHGYVVLSISHPHVSYGCIYEDGSIAKFDDTIVERAHKLGERPGYLEQFFAEDPAVRFETHLWICQSDVHPLGYPHYEIWVEDCLHTIERVCAGALPRSADVVANLCDTDRLATFGMSFGTSTTVAAFRDSRVKATINLDGGQFATDVTDIEMPIPTLILHSDHGMMMPGKRIALHSEFAYEKLATMGLDEKVQRFEIEGIGHPGVTDAALVPTDLKAANPAVAATIGSIDGQVMIDIMNDLSLAFFDKHLKGEGAGVSEALINQYPQVKDVDLSYIRDWASSDSKPAFMSRSHMFFMNRKAAASDDVRAALKTLDKRYLLVFELAGATDEETTWWQMDFDPVAGFAFRTGRPDDAPDMLMKGNYKEYMQFARAMFAGEATEADEPVERIGDASVLESISEVFLAVKTAAAIPTELPQE